MSDPLIGFIFDNRYEIIELIGTGAWSNVYKATDLNLGSDVAIKVFHRHLLKDEDNIKRFRREARLLSCFKSAHIIGVIDANTEPVPYIVMEYFDGVPLNAWLKENGPMNPQMAMDLFCQLCQCLSEAEEFDIVHRDLKPANIMIKTYGQIVEVKVVDFGFAKCLDQSSTQGSRITSSGDVLGSPQYMSPEQFKGQCDNRSDLYSLGCVMYEVLTGQPAFSAKCAMDYLHQHFTKKPARVSVANPELKLPQGLEEILFKCLEKSPDKRYKSGKFCRQALKAVKDGQKKPSYTNAHRSHQSKFSREGIVYSAMIIILSVMHIFGNTPARSGAAASNTPSTAAIQSTSTL